MQVNTTDLIHQLQPTKYCLAKILIMLEKMCTVLHYVTALDNFHKFIILLCTYNTMLSNLVSPLYDRPDLSQGDNGGSAGPLRCGKASTWEK